MTTTTPTPIAFLRAGWGLVRLDPLTVAFRAALDVGVSISRVAVLVLLGAVLFAHFIGFVEGGGGVLAWPAALGVELRDPTTVLAVGGVLFFSWCLAFWAEAFVCGGVLHVLSEGASSRPVAVLSTFWWGATERLFAAVKHRLLVVLFEATAAAVVVGTVAASGLWADGVAEAFDSAVAAPALVWGAALTMLSVFLLLARLTAEMVSAPLFLDDCGLGDAILRAAGLVVQRPVFVYRLFINALALVLPALFVYFLAAVIQNVALELPELAGMAALVRATADLLMVVSVAAFSVLLQATFMAYHAHQRGVMQVTDSSPFSLGRAGRGSKITLSDLMPRETPFIADLDTLLADWPASELSEPAAAPAPLPRPPSVEAFDLDAILRKPRASRPEPEEEE